MQTLDLIGSESGTKFAPDVYLDARLAGTSNRTALVLPGAERTHENSAFIEALAAEFSVVVPTHPGFGRSPRPDWCSTVADLADVYEEWLETSGHHDVTLIGLQFGGWVALELAARRLAQLSRLVLVDSVGVKFGGPLDRDIADVFATPHAALEKLYYADTNFGVGNLEAAPEDDVLEMARNEEALVLFGWEPYLHDPRLRRTIKRIDVPTAVIWGAQDGVVTANYGRQLSETIPGATFEVLEDAGHRAQVERPDEVAALVTKFAI